MSYNQMIKIYLMCDPRTKGIRYVGLTNNLDNRLDGHLSDPATTHKTAWIDELERIGLEPIMILIDACATREQAEEIEMRWIKFFRLLGSDLTNTIGMEPLAYRSDKAAIMDSAGAIMKGRIGEGKTGLDLLNGTAMPSLNVGISEWVMVMLGSWADRAVKVIDLIGQSITHEKGR